MSTSEENRRGLAPFYGLIILGLTAILLEFPVSWDGTPTCSTQEVGQGNCMYQAFQDGECLGTVFLEEPGSIPRILERIGVPQRVKWNGPQERIPCNRALSLGKDLRLTSIEKIKGTHIIAAGKRIDVNSADLEDLRAVPGIGPRLAERIIDQRDIRGRFAGIEELRQIRGIGKKKLAGWTPYIKAGPSRVVGNGLQNIQTSGSLLEPSCRIQE
jgi:competence ComEA-like helix-hairpin-helix protein